MQPQPPSPVGLLNGLIQRLLSAVLARRTVGLLANALAMLIDKRLLAIAHGFRDLAERIAAGRYRPGNTGPRRPSDPAKPRPQLPPRKAFGWLAAAVPEAGQFRGHVLHFLGDPDVANMIEVAPGQMRRLFRPLCWAMQLKPPPVLANPKRPKAPKAAAPLPLPSRGQAAKRTDGGGRGMGRENPGRSPVPQLRPAARPAPAGGSNPVAPTPAVADYQPDYSHHFLGPWYRRNG